MRKGAGREVLRSVTAHKCHGPQQGSLFFGRDWDLWGPLILCLMLGILLSINVSVFFTHSCLLRADDVGHPQAPKNQSLGVFTSVIVIVCVGSLVVTIQAKVGTSQFCG